MKEQDREAHFEQISDYFKGMPNVVADTEKGIFGVTDIDKVYKFFKDIKLETYKTFIDLGSGDGRVAIVGSLFTKTIGIEYDKDLVRVSNTHNRLLKTKAEFICQDYEDYNFKGVDVLFCFSDHQFTKTFIEKLQAEFTGHLFVYEGIFLPDGVSKGKTYWMGQTPVISYTFIQ